MTLELMSIIVGFLFISCVYLGWRLDKMQKHQNILLSLEIANHTIIGILTQALIDKKLLTPSELVYLKQEEGTVQQNQDPPK
jgi:hypothetical protein